MTEISLCMADGCSRPQKCRKMCKRHYETWLATAKPEEKAWRRTDYPDETRMIELAEDSVSMNDLARKIGVSREALRDYLAIRPALEEKVKKLSIRVPYTKEEAKLRDLDSKRNYARRIRSERPEHVRAINRRWGRNQSPEKRQRWNQYNRLRRKERMSQYEHDDDTTYFAGVVRNDICSFCNGVGGTVDHIVAIEIYGPDHWTNYAGACHSCNSSKGIDSVLQFMMRKKREAQYAI